ncbi:hypothetical protein Tco_0571713 [Tanacetum coccineum]
MAANIDLASGYCLNFEYGLVYNKFKEDKVIVSLVREQREMLQALEEIMLQDLQGLLSVITARVKGTWQGSALCLMLGFRASTLSTTSYS